MAIASRLSYAFTRVIDLAYTNHDIYYDVGLVVAGVVLLIFFTLYLWAIDTHGWIARFLDAEHED